MYVTVGLNGMEVEIYSLQWRGYTTAKPLQSSTHRRRERVFSSQARPYPWLRNTPQTVSFHPTHLCRPTYPSPPTFNTFKYAYVPTERTLHVVVDAARLLASEDGLTTGRTQVGRAQKGRTSEHLSYTGEFKYNDESHKIAGSDGLQKPWLPRGRNNLLRVECVHIHSYFRGSCIY
ncbi:hypothetical protein BC629DRAFT_913229 [Irpex lacteus]|nr:hypothetical protein BC629DRAFT_913229 [Irpex lacteus]